MTPRSILILLVLLGVGGCAEAPSVVPTRYTLTPRPQPRVSVSKDHSIRYPLTLRVEAIAAPQWLNSDDIYYQLIYADDDSIAAYSRSKWIAPPATLLGRLLQDRLADAHLWKAVIGPGSGANAELALRLRLDGFQQSFTAPKTSYGMLRADATLIDNRTAGVVAQTNFNLQVAAPTPDAAGGVDALNGASGKLLESISEWLSKAMARYRSADDQS
jgi:cholesterol transport system auxiliary component